MELTASLCGAAHKELEKGSALAKIYTHLFHRADRHDFLSQFLLIHSPFHLHSFLGGKRKGEKNNQSRGQKSCLSVLSISLL